MAQIRISLAHVTNFYTKPLCSTPQIHSSDEFVSPNVLTNNEHAEQVLRKEKQITFVSKKYNCQIQRKNRCTVGNKLG